MSKHQNTKNRRHGRYVPARGFLAILSWEKHINLPQSQAEVPKDHSAINYGDRSESPVIERKNKTAKNEKSNDNGKINSLGLDSLG